MEVEDIFSETIRFRGHNNVLSTHRNTVEITTDQFISKRADCILGVAAGKGCVNLSANLKGHIKSGGALRLEVVVEDQCYSFRGIGSPDLELSDPREIVFRRSDFASNRTVAICCSAAAVDIPRRMVRMLQKPETVGTLTIIALNQFQSIISESHKSNLPKH